MASYEVGSQTLGGWTIDRLIGEGSYGKVFEVSKTGYGVSTKSALKVVTVPPSQSFVKTAMSEGMDEASTFSYFRGIVDELMVEVAAMASLKGHPNVVGYEDHSVVEHEDEIGWDILLRMEMLTCLTDAQNSGGFTEDEVRKLGIQIASALSACHGAGIIHRDVKPSNIFVDDRGAYKLGDFGVSRAMSQSGTLMSKKGTESYMAPELYRGDARYDSTVDTYALGLVLYQLLNGGRLPFMPPAPEPITPMAREQSLISRISGEEIPAPRGASEAMTAIIRKACAPLVADRFSTAEEMKEALVSMALPAAAPVVVAAAQPTSEPSLPTAAAAPVVAEAPVVAVEATPAPVPVKGKKKAARAAKAEKPKKGLFTKKTFLTWAAATVIGIVAVFFVPFIFDYDAVGFNWAETLFAALCVGAAAGSLAPLAKKDWGVALAISIAVSLVCMLIVAPSRDYSDLLSMMMGFKYSMGPGYFLLNYFDNYPIGDILCALAVAGIFSIFSLVAALISSVIKGAFSKKNAAKEEAEEPIKAGVAKVIIGVVVLLVVNALLFALNLSLPTQLLCMLLMGLAVGSQLYAPSDAEAKEACGTLIKMAIVFAVLLVFGLIIANISELESYFVKAFSLGYNSSFFMFFPTMGLTGICCCAGAVAAKVLKLRGIIGK